MTEKQKKKKKRKVKKKKKEVKPTASTMLAVEDMKDLLKPQEKKDFESALYDVLKEMTNYDKSRILTELEMNEIKLVLRLKVLAKMRKRKIYDAIAELYMVLKISKGRASRKEILTAIKNAHPENPNQGINLDKVRQLLS